MLYIHFENEIHDAHTPTIFLLAVAGGRYVRGNSSQKQGSFFDFLPVFERPKVYQIVKCAAVMLEVNGNVPIGLVTLCTPCSLDCFN